MPIAYPVSLIPDEGDLVVRCRDLPELLTAGADEAEALDNAEDALVVTLLTYVEKGITLPRPSTPAKGERLVHVPAHVAAKLAI
jgi:antitoxin HicB